MYWFLLEKCSRNIIYDCQDCHASATPYSTNSFGGCIQSATGYDFNFNDYSGGDWTEGGYVISYDGVYIFDNRGNVSSSEKVLIGSHEECPKPPSLAPTSAAPTMPCALDETRLDVQFNLDSDPSGVYFFLIDRCTGPLLHDCQACFTGADPYSSKSFSRCLPNGHYSFIFNDYSGELWSQGKWTVNYDDAQLFDSTGAFKNSQEVMIGSKLDCPAVTTAAPQSVVPASSMPTPLPTPIPSTPGASFNYSTGCPSDKVRLDILFNFDADPSKVYWYLVDRCGEFLLHDCQGCYKGSEPGASKYFYQCVPQGHFAFIFNDYSGSTWSEGGYVLNYNGSKVFDSRGNVKPFNEVNFGSQEACQQPIVSPSAGPTSSPHHAYCEQFVLDIVTDSKSSETSWTLQQISGDNLGVISYGPIQGQQYENNSEYLRATTECLEPGEYQFIIYGK